MRHKECVEVLLDMSRWKVAGSTYTYNMIIQACGQRGDLTNALRAYNGMREAGVEPNTFTFAAILSACNYRGRPHLVEALRVTLAACPPMLARLPRCPPRTPGHQFDSGHSCDRSCGPR